MRRVLTLCLAILSMSLFTGCEESNHIISGIDEREANIIVVFLESKGISAKKELVASGPMVGGESAALKFNIAVDPSQAIEAMAILNSNGLPHRQGTNLLTLFEKQGLMSTDKEETIRYQAGLAQQIANMILMIDGVIDCNVQLSFPPPEAMGEESQKQAVTAAVFVKHQGIFDDPNSHLENKIKRLVSGSVQGLDLSNVTVVSDRSRFTDVSISPSGSVEPGNMSNEYVKIWSIVMSKESAARFRFIFTCLLFLLILLGIGTAWIVWKIYPTLKPKGGFAELLNPMPLLKQFKKGKKEGPPSEGNLV